MYKKLSLFSNILLFANTVLFLFCLRHPSDFYFVKLMICLLCMISLLLLTYIESKQKNKILRDKKYVLMSLFVGVVTFIIYLRDQFDFLIPLNSIYSVSSFGFESTGSLFLDYNLIFIDVMYIGLLTYNLLNKDKKIKSNSDSKKEHTFK